jgi:hypothetical protein
VSFQPTPQDAPAGSNGGKKPAWTSIIMWGVVIAMLALAVFLFVRRTSAAAPDPNLNAAGPARPAAATQTPVGPTAALPEWAPAGLNTVERIALPHTSIPERPPVDGQLHPIETGDSVFGLAETYKLKPETVLWANYGILRDNPDFLAIGQVLNIPATDGVLYKWKEGDTLAAVAGQFKAKTQDILLWPGNHLDLVAPEIKAGSLIMIPGGKRDFVRAWLLPTIPRGPAGVTTKLPGACNTGEGGPIGGGNFIWPTSIHSISGNDYWSGHLAIDIAAFTGQTVMAADSGVVVLAGWDTSGYGNVIMIDHGNGYQTLYAHLNALFVRCGQSVFRGGQIAAAGTTGNSTGPHLHFEIRYLGGFVNPHSFLK